MDKPGEVPVPGKEPEIKPEKGPEPNVWPRKEPEIKPEHEPLTTPPPAPQEIPKRPDERMRVVEIPHKTTVCEILASGPKKLHRVFTLYNRSRAFDHAFLLA
jgi:hypothetical protein